MNIIKNFFKNLREIKPYFFRPLLLDVCIDASEPDNMKYYVNTIQCTKQEFEKSFIDAQKEKLIVIYFIDHERVTENLFNEKIWIN